MNTCPRLSFLRVLFLPSHINSFFPSPPIVLSLFFVLSPFIPLDKNRRYMSFRRLLRRQRCFCTTAAIPADSTVRFIYISTNPPAHLVSFGDHSDATLSYTPGYSLSPHSSLPPSISIPTLYIPLHVLWKNTEVIPRAGKFHLW